MEPVGEDEDETSKLEAYKKKKKKTSSILLPWRGVSYFLVYFCRVPGIFFLLSISAVDGAAVRLH
jgi:hypothetical protein